MICLKETAAILVLCALISLNFMNLPVNSSPDAIRVPDNYPTIALAIDAASAGDTILVAEGTYFEHLAIEKPLTLVGANCATVIDGYGSGTVVSISASNVNFTGFTVRNSSLAYPSSAILLDGCRGVNIVGNVIKDFNGYSVFLNCSWNNNIIDNNITNNDYGIQVEYSHGNNVVDNRIFYNRYGIGLVDSENNTITNNSIFNCFEGIDLRFSSGNLLRNNKLLGNTLNFGVMGNSQSDFLNNVDTSNTVNYKPIYYWTNQHDKQVPNDAGYVAIINSTNITVSNLTLTDNLQGMLVAFTNDSVIEEVDASWNDNGIELLYSNNNRITRTNVAINYILGIQVVESNGNTFESNVIKSNHVFGFYLQYSNYSRIINNTVASNIHFGIALEVCDHNLISDNTLSANEVGLLLFRSAHNAIATNKIESNEGGIKLMFPATSANTIQENTIQSNDYGIYMWGGVQNVFFHNSLINNTYQVTSEEELNAWDNGVEGNYWNDYNGTDIDHNGIGDSPYAIDEVNKDQHPLMSLYATAPPTIPSDLNRDGIVDIYDSLKASNAFGSCPGCQDYDINIDANQDLTIDIFDMIALASNFGKTNSTQAS